VSELLRLFLLTLAAGALGFLGLVALGLTAYVAAKMGTLGFLMAHQRFRETRRGGGTGTDYSKGADDHG
jgi:hypothetical protein